MAPSRSRTLLTLATLGLLVAFLAPSAARAQVELGVRTGWAIPAGHAFSGGDLAGLVNGALPVQVDASWRFGRSLSAGAYASFALARVDPHLAEDAGGGSAFVARAGLRASWAFPDLVPAARPWVGVGAGWEWMKVSAGGRYVYSGPELATVEGGADWTAGAFRVGPFVSWSLGRYLLLNGDDLSPKGGHAWVTLGVRGTFGS